jgi:universal stress protein A
MTGRVVVGLDLNDGCRQVFHRAQDLAKRLGLPLLAVHVILPAESTITELRLASAEPGWFDQPKAEKATSLLREITGGDPAIETKILWGRPWPQLVANIGAGDWLVVGQKRERHVLRRLFNLGRHHPTHCHHGSLVIVPCD